MKTREEISAMLNGYVDAKPEEQAQVMSGILDEYDTAISESSASLPAFLRVLTIGVKPMTICEKIM